MDDLEDRTIKAINTLAEFYDQGDLIDYWGFLHDNDLPMQAGFLYLKGQVIWKYYVTERVDSILEMEDAFYKHWIHYRLKGGQDEDEI